MGVFKSLSMKTKGILAAIGAALVAFVMILFGAFRAGKRKQQEEQLENDHKEETNKIDELANSGNADELLDDIMRRTKEK